MTKALPLADVAEVLTGTSIDRKRRTQTGVLVFGLDQVADRPRELPPCIPEGEIPARAASLRAGDVVLALIGKAGRSVVVNPEYDGAVLDRECAAVRVKDSSGPVSQEWLQVWARSSHCRIQMEAYTAGIIPRIPTRALRAFHVPVVPLEEQLRAHAELGRLDAAVAATRHTVDVLEPLRSTVIDLSVYGSTSDRQQ